jgi:hydrogenase maturation factor
MLGWRETSSTTFDADVLGVAGISLVAFQSRPQAVPEDRRSALEQIAQEFAGLAQFALVDADVAGDLCRRFSVGDGDVVLIQDGVAIHRLTERDAADTLERHLRAGVPDDDCVDGSCSLPR